MYLWRAVDHEGEVLDVLVQRRRDEVMLRAQLRGRIPGSARC
jgi:transposase-like protein